MKPVPGSTGKPGQTSPELGKQIHVTSGLGMQSALLASRLMQLRLSKNISQKELGKRLRASAQLISSWETGRRTLSLHFGYLVMLAAFYGISIHELLDFRALENPVGNHLSCSPGHPATCSECRGFNEERKTA